VCVCVCEREGLRNRASRRALGALIKNSFPCSLVLKQYEDVAIVWIESAH